ncbi:flagellar export chaperone FlgN [Microbacterium sp. ARD31]|uniref:flagellar export chaperone FlgN n=1 Tax=Microbacterium sp. ARD31 TaxID=2962576 RepID=UPI002880E07B|nr:flagellar export chaperone FlgN [Microbacterium sp. ARD31]MDT0188096.1 flagellar export chaperone FlgN [Microbacterium sp. ARD31]
MNLTDDIRATAMEKLSLVLWRERELLEELHYRLEVEQLVLASGRSRWLAHATRDIDTLLVTIRETEMLRAVAADEAAAASGMSSNPSLASLAEAAGEPWTTILTEHREAFVSLTNDIGTLADSNRHLISAGYRSARETLMSMSDSVDGYAADGSATAEPLRASLVDRSL